MDKDKAQDFPTWLDFHCLVFECPSRVPKKVYAFCKYSHHVLILGAWKWRQCSMTESPGGKLLLSTAIRTFCWFWYAEISNSCAMIVLTCFLLILGDVSDEHCDWHYEGWPGSFLWTRLTWNPHCEPANMAWEMVGAEHPWDPTFLAMLCISWAATRCISRASLHETAIGNDGGRIHSPLCLWLPRSRTFMP